MDDLGVVDREAFMTVGYIQEASCLGGCLGMVVRIWLLFRTDSKIQSRPNLLETESNHVCQLAK